MCLVLPHIYVTITDTYKRVSQKLKVNLKTEGENYTRSFSVAGIFASSNSLVSFDISVTKVSEGSLSMPASFMNFM